MRVGLPGLLGKQNPIDLGNQTKQVLPRPGFPRKGQDGFVEFEGQSSFELVETQLILRGSDAFPMFVGWEWLRTPLSREVKMGRKIKGGLQPGDVLGWTSGPSDQLAPITRGKLTHLPGHVTILVTPSSVSLRSVLVHLLLVVQLAIRSWLLPWETPEKGSSTCPR